MVIAYGLNQPGLDNNMWPLFVTEMHTNPGRLNLTSQTTEPVLRNRAIRKTWYILPVSWINRMFGCCCFNNYW